MQFKDLFHNKNIARLLIFAVALFLLLPLIFPEKTDLKIINKERQYSREESPLPIFPKENLLEKYVNKLKKFYKMDIPVFNSSKQENEIPDDTAEDQITNKEKENIEITAGDLFFSMDNDGDENADQTTEQKDNTVNLQKGTVLTKDGKTLEPTQDGYYHNGKFYRNGTYPKNYNKRYIEGALSRYHSRVAQNLGKKALYLADENGNLTVSYVDELPDEISIDIDTYLAQNQNKNNSPLRNFIYNINQNNAYKNAKIKNSGNRYANTSDIATASIKNIHAAYNLLSEKIKSGEILNLIPKPQNLIPMGNIILEQANIAQPPIENPSEQIYCHGDECSDSFKIAPIIIEDEHGDRYSDLHYFYASFCTNTCPYSMAYTDRTLSDKPLNLDFQKEEDINTLREEIANSDKHIVEIAYIHPNEEYRNLLTSLQEMSLTNKNGEEVEIRLRGRERVPDNVSFGEKMAGPFKSSIKRDLISENNEVSYDTLVGKYNKVDETFQNNISENNNFLIYQEFYPNADFNPPVAFVERSKDEGFFIINAPDIPKGYIREIPQWERYRVDNDFGSYYKVPENILFNPPPELTIIAIQEDEKNNITLQDGHPVATISKKNLQNLNFDNVQSTRYEIFDAQIKNIQYNNKLLEETQNN